MGGRTSRTAIDSAFALEPDRRPSPMSRTAALIAKYGGRVPRYTSYPTAAQFTPAVAEADHRAWLAALDARSPVSLYLHVPFCDRLCWYCGCHTAVVHQRGPVADYVRTLVREIEITSQALPESAQASALHFGGGTPNIIAPDDLRALVGALRERFTFTAPFEFAVELDPRILTSEWVDAAADLGLNRASLGVQDLNAQVQRAINRLQPYAQIEWAVTRLRQAGDCCRAHARGRPPHPTNRRAAETHRTRTGAPRFRPTRAPPAHSTAPTRRHASLGCSKLPP